jgi:hypothetical protein
MGDSTEQFACAKAARVLRDSADSGENGLGNNARVAVEMRAGRVLSDSEWEHAQAVFLQFVDTLCRWQGSEQNDGSNETS